MNNKILGAFDIGSGAIKLTVCSISNNNITNIFYENQISCLVAHSVKQSKDKKIEQDIKEKMIKTINILIKEAENIQKPQEYSGIATAIYRETINGEDIINNISSFFNFPILIISQEIEGYLGFLTAAIGENKSCISWDSGGASFQLVSLSNYPECNNIKNMNIIEGPLGSSKVTSLIIEEIQKKNFTDIQSVNPITNEECKLSLELILNKLSILSKPNWITKESYVIGIGGKTCMFKLASLLCNNTTEFTINNLQKALESIINKTDDEIKHLPEKEMAPAKLLLMIGVMKYFNIEKVIYKKSNGSTQGMFLYPSLWK